MDKFEKWCKENFIVPISKDDVLHECWQEATKKEQQRIVQMCRNSGLYAIADRIEGK